MKFNKKKIIILLSGILIFIGCLSTTIIISYYPVHITKKQEINNIVPDKEINKNDTPKEEINKEDKDKENKEEEQEKTDEAPKEENPSPELPKDDNKKPPVEIEKDENDQLRNSIFTKYKIKVKYGDEIGSYKPRNLTPIKMTDKDTISEYLTSLNKTLSRYPNGFFQEMYNKGMPLTIFLIENVSDYSLSGLTDKEFYDDIKITLTTRGFFDRVTNHELMHYIDAYLQIVMYPLNVEDSWNLLNPPDFTYGYTNSSYTYNMLNHPRGAYFINDYAQTNYLEDRASTFEDMMSRAYAPPGCYEEGEVIKEKGKLIASQIETYFNSVSPSVTEPWERFLK